MSIRETLTRIRDDAQAALDALDAAPEKPTLGPRGEYSPVWLRVLNNAYINKYPAGYTDQAVDPNAPGSRVPLVLAGDLLWPDVPAKLDAEQAAEINRWCDVIAWWAQASTINRAPAGFIRIAPVWRGSQPTVPGQYTLCLARTLWPTEAELEAAVVDFYERQFGPL